MLIRIYRVSYLHLSYFKSALCGMGCDKPQLYYKQQGEKWRERVIHDKWQKWVMKLVRSASPFQNFESPKFEKFWIMEVFWHHHGIYIMFAWPCGKLAQIFKTLMCPHFEIHGIEKNYHFPFSVFIFSPHWDNIYGKTRLYMILVLSRIDSFFRFPVFVFVFACCNCNRLRE